MNETRVIAIGPENPDFGSWNRVGTSFLAECAVFAALGWWLDSKFETNPWLLVTGVMLGVGYATWNLLRQFGGEVEAPAEKKGDDG